MTVGRRRVARAVRPGGPEVIAIAFEDLPALQGSDALVRVEVTASIMPRH